MEIFRHYVWLVINIVHCAYRYNCRACCQTLNQVRYIRLTLVCECVVCVCTMAGVWGFGVDPSSFHSCEARESPGLGDVRLCVLFRHDLPLACYLCLWRPQEQHGMGHCGKSNLIFETYSGAEV